MWHLGLAAGHRPEEHGFDESFGFLAGASDYYSRLYYYGRQTLPVHDLWHNGKEVFRNDHYLTHLITEHAVAFLRHTAQGGGEHPFFLYVPFNAPHWLLHAPPEYLDRFRGLSPERRIMAAMVSAMDDGVGAILDEVTRQGLADNTCVFFMSDNGPSREVPKWLDGGSQPFYGSSAGPLKGHKYSLYDSGIRVPAIPRWPAGIPGGRVIEEVGAGVHVFPTFLTMAGGDPASQEWLPTTAGATLSA